MVNAALAVLAADQNQKQTVAKALPHLSEYKYVETFMELLLIDDFTSSYSQEQVVCTIGQSVHN